MRALSRASAEYRVDLTTGEGLGAALEGCQVVIDVTNNSSRNAAQTLVDGSRRLLEAERAAGVRHHVGVSIVGCDKVPMGYFQVKAEQERVVEQGPVPWSLIRATQFHEYIATMLDAGARWRILPVPRASLQTIASETGLSKSSSYFESRFLAVSLEAEAGSKSKPRQEKEKAD